MSDSKRTMGPEKDLSPNFKSLSPVKSSEDEACPDDDWETVADREPDKLLPPKVSIADISKLSLDDRKVKSPKRRGRGTFSYKHGLYSDRDSDEHVMENSSDDVLDNATDKDAQTRELKFGTRHVLVLADLPPSTRTRDLDKLLENCNDLGFALRWVNNTTAVAAFRAASDAREAFERIRCPYTVRVLEENDVLLSSIPESDLEPPRQRPKTSASAAQRMIAHGMGLRLPSSSVGSAEMKQREAARKQRILSRQNMKEDAWGDD